MRSLSVCDDGDRYGDEKLRFALVALVAAGVVRLSHINRQPKESWGVVLDSVRRPDGDTLDSYLKELLERDEEGVECSIEERLGRIRADGLIVKAQQSSLRYWAEADLLKDEVWRFDGHTIEYYGEGKIGKTKHGTKAKSVHAVDRYTLYNGICGLTDYFPTSTSYDEALREMIGKAQEALPEEYRIRKLCFDKEGWKGETLKWLWEEHKIAPIVWVKNTAPNVAALNRIDDAQFVDVPHELLIGKGDKHQVMRIADTTVHFPTLGLNRVLALEIVGGKRIAIFTTAPTPEESPLDDPHCISTVSLLEALRLQQHVENSFKVDVHQMGTDALPMHKVLTVEQSEPYALDKAKASLESAQKRYDKYTNQLEENLPELDQNPHLDQGDLNLLSKRAQRLQKNAQNDIDTLSAQIESVQVDEQGQATQVYTREVLDLRKLTLLNLFKAHALVALIIIARQLGWDGAGPQRLRDTFLAFGHRVEFDSILGIATVYPVAFPSSTTQKAYEQLCSHLHDVPISLTRNGIHYKVRFAWDHSTL